MRTGDPPGGAGQRHALALPDHLPLLHFDAREMGVEAVHAMAVVDHHEIAEEVEPVCQGDPAGGGGGERCARRHREIQPVMRLPRWPLDAAAAIDPDIRPRAGAMSPREAVSANRWHARRRGARARADALQRLGVRRDLGGRQAAVAPVPPRRRAMARRVLPPLAGLGDGEQGLDAWSREAEGEGAIRATRTAGHRARLRAPGHETATKPPWARPDGEGPARRRPDGEERQGGEQGAAGSWRGAPPRSKPLPPEAPGLRTPTRRRAPPALRLRRPSRPAQSWFPRP